jgi:hypothetical protein
MTSLIPIEGQVKIILPQISKPRGKLEEELRRDVRAYFFLLFNWTLHVYTSMHQGNAIL